MEKELNYLSTKISDLEWDISYSESESKKSQDIVRRGELTHSLEDMNEELEILNNILNALTISELTV